MYTYVYVYIYIHTYIQACTVYIFDARPSDVVCSKKVTPNELTLQSVKVTALKSWKLHRKCPISKPCTLHPAPDTRSSQET